jgi:uncharacterized protein (TIGR02118 family)
LAGSAVNGSAGVPDLPSGVVKLTVLYGPPTDPDAFDTYYFDIHVPLADRIPGLLRNEVTKLASIDGSPAPFHLLAELYFDNAEALATAMRSAVRSSVRSSASMRM